MSDRGRSLVDRLFEFILLLIFGPFLLCIAFQFVVAILNALLVTVKVALSQMLPWLVGALGLAIVIAGIGAAFAVRNRVGHRNFNSQLPPLGAPPVRRARAPRYRDDEFDD